MGHVKGMLDGHEVPIKSYAQRSQVMGLMRGSRNLILCGASGDLAAAAKVGRRAVFTQHGAGQSFLRKSPSYAGYPHHKKCGDVFCILGLIQLLRMQLFMARRM